MKRLWIGVAVALLLGRVAFADDPPKKADPPAAQEKKEDADSPMGKYKAARKTFNDAQKKFSQVISEIKKKGEEPNTNKHPELAGAEKNYVTTRDAMVAAAMAAAKAEPKSPDALQAVETALGFGMGIPGFMDKSGPEIIQLLREHFVENPKVGNLCGMLPTYTDKMMQATEPFLRAVMEKNPEKATRGKATVALGRALMRTNKPEAERLLEQVVSGYTDVKSWRGTLSSEAAGHLFELRHLQVGMVAPDIEGEDLEGKKFKLSDYRGKVVMLDFWGHW